MGAVVEEVRAQAAAAVASEYARGLSCRLIADLYGVRRSRVRTLLAHARVKVRGRGARFEHAGRVVPVPEVSQALEALAVLAPAPRRPRRGPDETAWLGVVFAALYEDGATLKNIADTHGMSPATVRRLVVLGGAVIRPQHRGVLRDARGRYRSRPQGGGLA